MTKWSVLLAITVIIIASLVLVGWEFDISVLRHPLPGSKAMNPIAAVIFILASSSFLFLTKRQSTERGRRTGYFLATLVLLIGLLKLVSIIFSLDFHPDALLFRSKLGTDRIVPPAAINFTLTGFGLLLLHAKTKRKEIASNVILLTIFSISLFSVLGYLYQVEIFYGVFTYLPMAIHAAACFLFLSISMLFFNSDKGLMKELTGPLAGSIAAQKLIPAAILVPALLGFLRMIGHWTNSFTTEFGVTVLVFSITMVLLTIMWYSIVLLNKRDFQSKLVEKALKESEQQIQTLFNAAPDAVIVIDQNGIITKWNPKAESIFGWRGDEVIGKMLSETIIPERYKEAHKKGLNRFVQTGEGPVVGKTIEIQAITKDNIEFDVALSISPTTINEKLLFIGFIRDITSRKRSEEKLLKLSQELEQKVIERTEELAKSEKLFRAMIEKDADMKTLVSPDGKVSYASPSITTILGYEIPEFLASPAFTLIHPDDLPGFMKGITDLVKTPGKSFYRQQRFRHKNGKWIWCEGTITNMLHESAVAALVSNFRDISERKGTEEALHQSQQLLSAIINNSTAVIYVKDLEGRYMLVNRRFSEVFHRSEDTILGTTDYDFFSKEQADAFRQMDVRTAVADHALTEEEQVPQDDGLHTYLSVKSTLRNDSGNPYAIFGISTDITDRKEAEESIRRAEANYREIFDKASDAIYVHDIETGKIIEVNQRASDITGYSKEELISADLNDFITGHPQYTMEHAFNYLQKAAQGTPQLFEWLGKNKDGSHNWLEVNLKKANIAGQDRILAFFREINDRKKTQLEIEQLNEELEQKVIDRTAELQTANKDLESFSYSVSHDLRAPLRIIDGYTKLVLEDYAKTLDQEGNRMLGVIASNAQKMGHLIDDLLNFSRLGRKELIIRLVNMEEVVEAVIAEQRLLETSNASIQVGRLEPAYCDNNLITQVWVNYLSNAVKYSREKENPVIEINSVKAEQEIIYSVKDNGVGFDMKYANKLFGVFQRLHSLQEFEGTGVGLALVQRIVNKHGGRVWADAELNKGAIFYFSLPIIPVELTQIPTVDI
jgi:PAS domain S-box-containing protein